MGNTGSDGADPNAAAQPAEVAAPAAAPAEAKAAEDEVTFA
jgi:hypothetical protein